MIYHLDPNPEFCAWNIIDKNSRTKRNVFKPSLSVDGMMAVSLCPAVSTGPKPIVISGLKCAKTISRFWNQSC